MHLYGSLNGTFHVCCHAEFASTKSIELGDSTQSLKDIWNSENFRYVRKSFLQGKPPLECIETCYDVEKKGGTSNRNQVNKRFLNKQSLQNLTNQDGSVNNFPSYIDLRFGNLCNFKCRMCGPHASTSWYKEAGTNYSNVIDHYTDNTNIWDDLPDFLPYIEDVYFAGGEPFVQDGHYKLLNILINSGYSKNVSLQYNTNLSYDKYKNFDLISMWKNFKNVSLWPSIEGWEKQAEYSRKGLSWKKFVNNSEKFNKYINTYSSVISIYSIYTMPELIMWFKKQRKDYFGTLLLNPSYLSVTCLPQESKDLIIQKYKKFIYENKNILKNHEIEQMLSWLRYMKSTDDSYLLSEFKKEQEKLDNSRNESFTVIYPEFSKWYTNI